MFSEGAIKCLSLGPFSDIYIYIYYIDIVRPVFPQSEVLVKFVPETGEKSSENWAKNFADFRPSVSRESVRKKFHAKSLTFSTLHQIKFFHCCNSGRWGPQYIARFPLIRNPVERDSGREFIELQGQNWSGAWCRGLIRA